MKKTLEFHKKALIVSCDCNKFEGYKIDTQRGIIFCFLKLIRILKITQYFIQRQLICGLLIKIWITIFIKNKDFLITVLLLWRDTMTNTLVWRLSYSFRGIIHYYQCWETDRHNTGTLAESFKILIYRQTEGETRSGEGAAVWAFETSILTATNTALPSSPHLLQ